MVKHYKALTDNTIKNAKIKAHEYVLSDGDGVQVRIRPNGTKSFQFRYRHPQTNKINRLAMGKYPHYTLKDARTQANIYNRQIALGEDPRQLREQAKQEYAKTLKTVALMWFELKKTEISEGHAKDIWCSLENHVFDRLADVPIIKINAPDTIQVLKRLQMANKRETLQRICNRLNEIMDYALNYGFISTNPLMGIRKVFPKPIHKHHPSIKIDKLSEFMNKLFLGDMYIATRCLVQFQLHTLTRASEASNAKWQDINLDEKMWIIPAEEKKNYRINNPDTHHPHRIPLTEQTLAILEQMKPISHSSPFVFASRMDRSKPVNSQTVNTAIKALGYEGKLVSHGLRTIGNSELKKKGFNDNAVEAALSHLVGNATSRAYSGDNDYFEIRVHLMKWWSQFIEYTAKGISPPADFLQPYVIEPTLFNKPVA